MRDVGKRRGDNAAVDLGRTMPYWRSAHGASRAGWPMDLLRSAKPTGLAGQRGKPAGEVQGASPDQSHLPQQEVPAQQEPALPQVEKPSRA